MKKYIFLILIAVILTVIQMHGTYAAQNDDHIHNNNHAVLFDGNGKGIVRAEIDVGNTLNRDISGSLLKHLWEICLKEV